ncbi:MAG: tRNA (adenosine(37)-N6)-dimethylallyltransferase MiaA [Chlorobi bacterium]|nr:tRNA (adenosine(37)-N6)-dimethylallyltransferase MiaA [Chlorobiota bacterium]
MNRLICILGPTATGKTSLASHLAALIGAEIISADSRQVYAGMDIGTGKDIGDYTVGGVEVPYHLIDIKEPGYEYNVFEYQNDFVKAYKKIIANEKIPILCGGSGMYLDSILRAYEMNKVPENKALRTELQQMPDKQLSDMLNGLQNLHNTSDTTSRARMIRAIEVAKANKANLDTMNLLKSLRSINFGILFDRQTIRERITERLVQRLENGMLDEIGHLLEKGVSKDELLFYGLEYKFLTRYVSGDISYDEMFDGLNTAIHQFAKRQMTWFRRMQKQGVRLNWIDGNLSMEEKISLILNVVSKVS